MQINYIEPFSDADMVYDFDKHRYVLTTQYCRNRGFDFELLDKDKFPDPQVVNDIVLDRVSLLVYTNIYNYGRTKREKEFLLACHPDFRDIIKEAMFERLLYMNSSGDLSVSSGALISQGTRIDTIDLVPSVMEQMILRPTGLLHRGEFELTIDDELVYQMDPFEGNMPQIAFFLEDAEATNRVKFKCRIEQDGAQFYTRNIGGLIDTGTNAVIVTKKPLEYKSGARVIMDDIMYSVISITPFIPDNIVNGIRRRKASTQYVLQLG